MILLILATISMNLVIGDNGLVSKAQESAFKTELASIKEQYLMDSLFSEDLTSMEITEVMPIKDQKIGYEQYAANCMDNKSLIDIYVGGLQEILSMLERIEELLENGSSSGDLEMFIDEINALLEAIDYCSTTTSFNNILLLNENKYIYAYYEKDKYKQIELKDFSVEGLGIEIDTSSTDSINQSISSVSNAVSIVENEISEKNSLSTELNNKAAELQNNANSLNSSSDSIELEDLSENGELESDKINQIDSIIENCEELIDVIKTAEGQEQEIVSKLQSITNLLMQSTNGTMEEENLNDIMVEINALKLEIDEISSNTNYNGEKLLDGTYNKTVEIGIYGENILISISNLNTDYLGENNTPLYLDNSTIDNANKSLETVAIAIEKLSRERSNIGAIQNRLQNTISYHNKIKDVLNSRIEKAQTKSTRLALAGLDEIQECLTYIRKCIIKSQKDIYSTIDRENIYEDIIQQQDEINRIANNTKNEEISLLNGEYDSTLNVTLSGLNIVDISNATLSETNDSLEKIEIAIKKVFKLRRELAQEDGYVSKDLEDIISDSKWSDKLEIVNGELTFIGTDKQEKEWAKELGINVQ